MLSDNIRNYRKEYNMSQDELADKLGVSRQSVSLWENGQTQPTIDNIVAMAKIFNISSDMLLQDGSETAETATVALTEPLPQNQPQNQPPKQPQKKPQKKAPIVPIVIAAAAVVIIAATVVVAVLTSKDSGQPDKTATGSTTAVTEPDSEPSNVQDDAPVVDSTTVGEGKTSTTPSKSHSTGSKTTKAPQAAPATTTAAPAQFDLFSYCKDFAIQIGRLNGDYTIYQQPSSKYGGYDGEYFSISYWSDSNMVEFCLHCPLDDTLSHNFYLRMRGGYNHKYEYMSSKYYRDNGESLRYATGYIDPAVFSDKYPIGCDKYEGSADGQDTFMEDTRVGMCDLIRCLKQFVDVEKMDCDFSAFEFKNF